MVTPLMRNALTSYWLVEVPLEGDDGVVVTTGCVEVTLTLPTFTLVAEAMLVMEVERELASVTPVKLVGGVLKRTEKSTSAALRVVATAVEPTVTPFW
jgi:hypothetical protein